MENIDLNKISQLLSQKFKKPVKIVGIEKAGGGYHSEGFKLTDTDGRSYFLKYLHSHDLGFEFTERQIMSMMVSNSMGLRVKNDPKPLGVIVMNEDEDLILPEIKETTKVFHIQEFGGAGESYSTYIHKNLHKKSVDEEDRRKLSAIAEALVRIHSVKHPSGDIKRLKAIYDDGVRNVLSNPELSLMVLSEFPADYKILDLEGQKEFIGLMYENIRHMMGQHERLSALHGDFWGANIFFRDNGSLFIIDYSRIPWGDPGIDVGWFLAEIIYLYHSVGNDYFRELAETWLDIYEQKSGDRDIRKNIPLVIGWTGIVQIYPRWFPNEDIAIGKKYIGHIKEILRNKKLTWKD